MTQGIHNAVTDPHQTLIGVAKTLDGLLGIVERRSEYPMAEDLGRTDDALAELVASGHLAVVAEGRYRLTLAGTTLLAEERHRKFCEILASLTAELKTGTWSPEILLEDTPTSKTSPVGLTAMALEVLADIRGVVIEKRNDVGMPQRFRIEQHLEVISESSLRWPGLSVQQRNIITEITGTKGLVALLLSLLTIAPLAISLKSNFLALDLSLATIVYAIYHGTAFYLWINVRQLRDSTQPWDEGKRASAWDWCTRASKVHNIFLYPVLLLIGLTFISKARSDSKGALFALPPEFASLTLGIPIVDEPSSGDRWYPRARDAANDKEAALKAAKDEAWFLGSNFYTTSDDRQDIVRGKLRDGVSLHFLLPIPNTKTYQINAQTLGQPTAQQLEKWKVTTRNFRAIQKSAGDAGARLQIRVADIMIPIGIYLFDPRSDEGVGLLVPHFPKRNARLVPAVWLERNRAKEVYDTYFDGIQSAWNDATPLEEWLEKNPSFAE